MDDTKMTEEIDNDMEALSSDGFSEVKETEKKEKKKWKRWQKILFGTIIAILIVLVGAISAIFILRQRGENRLKAEEHYTTYNGKRYKFREDVVNILCLGIDKNEPIAHIERKRGNIGMSDAILLVSIDLKEDEVKIFAIPRDSMADIQTTSSDGQLQDKQRMQLCYQYAYGVSMEQSNELTVDAVSHLLYDTPIQRCCAINFEALPVLNDAIGGVDVVIEEDLEEFVPEFIYGEEIHLEGKLALSFVRSRNTKRVDGVVLRTQRQKQYALAFAEKAKDVISENPTLPITLFQELQKDKNMCTDITVEDITYLMPELFKISFSDDIIQVLPGESVLGESGFAEYKLDVDSVKKMIIDTFYEEVE